VSYVHSPIRYAWDLQHAYLREAGLDRGLKSVMARWVLHRIRQWDARSANGVDVFISNSGFIADRIWKVYRRGAHVIHPPVAVEEIHSRSDKEEFYVTASRFVPYKRIPLIVEAFARMPERRLVVIGDGPESSRVQAAARGCDNVQLMGHLPRAELLEWLGRAAGFVFAAEEDFGIAPVEALAAGTPVIAYGRGGTLESVTEGVSGVFFDEQTVDGIRAGIAQFEARGDWDADAIRQQATRFSIGNFRQAFSGFVDARWCEFNDGVRQFDRPVSASVPPAPTCSDGDPADT